jgi:hypothetical protein
MRKQVSESTIEKTVCKHAKHNDWLVYKFSSPAQRGVPDRVFLKAGRIVFVEFKATGKKATKQQIATHEKIRSQGFEVHVIDNIEAGKALFND